MRKTYYLLPLVLGAILIAAAVMGQPDPAPTESGAQPGGSRLKVSSQGSIINTNVESGSLQQATPPENSATSASTNPQPAVPNYCQPGEQPIVDGCVSQ